MEFFKMTDERGNILLEAHETINQRKQLHGAPENTFAIIADMWNGYLTGLAKTIDCGEKINMAFPQLDGVDVAHLMVLFKLARQINGADCKDDHRDAAGYIALAAELAGNNDGHHGALLGDTGKDVKRYFDAVLKAEEEVNVGGVNTESTPMPTCNHCGRVLDGEEKTSYFSALDKWYCMKCIGYLSVNQDK